MPSELYVSRSSTMCWCFNMWQMLASRFKSETHQHIVYVRIDSYVWCAPQWEQMLIQRCRIWRNTLALSSSFNTLTLVWGVQGPNGFLLVDGHYELTNHNSCLSCDKQEYDIERRRILSCFITAIYHSKWQDIMLL